MLDGELIEWMPTLWDVCGQERGGVVYRHDDDRMICVACGGQMGSRHDLLQPWLSFRAAQIW